MSITDFCAKLSSPTAEAAEDTPLFSDPVMTPSPSTQYDFDPYKPSLANTATVSTQSTQHKFGPSRPTWTDTSAIKCSDMLTRHELVRNCGSSHAWYVPNANSPLPLGSCRILSHGFQSLKRGSVRPSEISKLIGLASRDRPRFREDANHFATSSAQYRTEQALGSLGFPHPQHSSSIATTMQSLLQKRRVSPIHQTSVSRHLPSPLRSSKTLQPRAPSRPRLGSTDSRLTTVRPSESPRNPPMLPTTYVHQPRAVCLPIPVVP